MPDRELCLVTDESVSISLERNRRYADDTTLMAESEELKSLLRKVKEESEKNWLKTQHSEN